MNELKRVALSTLGFSALRRAVNSLSPIIGRVENGYIKKYAAAPPRSHPVFIIGAPRTGSTFLYQCITHHFDVCYIDNLADMFYGNLFFGMDVSRRIFKKPHNCFQSNYGNTFQYGFHAPNESGDFWYRWIQKGAHYVDETMLTVEQKGEIQAVVMAIINKHQKPFVFKNMNAALRMRLIHAIFPQAKFIIIRRDIRKTRDSILKARKELYGDCMKWWSLKPPGYETILDRSPEEQVEYQVRKIYEQIDMDRGLFPEDGFLEIQFKEFLEHKEAEMERIRRFIFGSDSL